MYYVIHNCRIDKRVPTRLIMINNERFTIAQEQYLYAFCNKPSLTNIDDIYSFDYILGV